MISRFETRSFPAKISVEKLNFSTFDRICEPHILASYTNVKSIALISCPHMLRLLVLASCVGICVSRAQYAEELEKARRPTARRSLIKKKMLPAPLPPPSSSPETPASPLPTPSIPTQSPTTTTQEEEYEEELGPKQFRKGLLAANNNNNDILPANNRESDGQNNASPGKLGLTDSAPALVFAQLILLPVYSASAPTFA